MKPVLQKTVQKCYPAPPPKKNPTQNYPVLSVGAGTVSKVIWRVTIGVGRRMK